MKDNNIYIVGPNSRLAKFLGVRARHFSSISLRPDQLSGLSQTLEGTFIIFSDPPSVHDTLAGIGGLLSRIPLRSKSRILFVSSISATYWESKRYPHEGSYAKRKRLAEQLVSSRSDLSVTIVRLGNVFAITGWKIIRETCPILLLPLQSPHIAVADLDILQTKLNAAPLSAGVHVFNAYQLVRAEEYFERVIRLPSLMALYRSSMGKLTIKLAARVLRKIGIYLPSPDDLNSFLLED